LDLTAAARVVHRDIAGPSVKTPCTAGGALLAAKAGLQNVGRQPGSEGRSTERKRQLKRLYTDEADEAGAAGQHRAPLAEQVEFYHFRACLEVSLNFMAVKKVWLQLSLFVRLREFLVDAVFMLGFLVCRMRRKWAS
jgi:hypothetical protein